MKILYELFAFAVRPTISESKGAFSRQAIKHLMVLFVTGYSAKTLWLLTVNRWIRSTVVIQRSEIGETNTTLIEFFLLAVVVFPVVEEFIFRYFLKRKTALTILILSVVFSVGLAFVFKHFTYPNVLVWRITMVACLIIPILIGYWYYLRLNKSGVLDHIVAKVFPFLFYFSVFSFALMHTFNFTIAGSVLWLLPMMVPFVISGIVLGFARMKWGIAASIMIHMLFNLTTFILDKGFGI